METQTSNLENTDLCNVLLKWLQTLQLRSPHQNLYDLTDGLVIAEALNQIDPEFFNKEWFSKIKIAVGHWRLKVSNLKKIVEKIQDFYQECDNQNVAKFIKPDVVKIGEHNDFIELGLLLKLVLGCAVNCSNAQDYILKIRLMDENSQTVIMQCIQDLEIVHSPNNITSNFEIDLNQNYIQQLLKELQTITDSKDELKKRCLELDYQISLLHEENKYILDEKNQLEQILLDNPLKHNDHKKQIDDLKEKLYIVETSRDDYRMKLENQEIEMCELKTKFDLLQESAIETRLLKDELDILRDTADKVEKYECTIQTYKNKLEGLNDLKQNIKLLEAKNISYVQQNLALEQEMKKSSVWKSQLEMYKLQVNDLNQILRDDTYKIDKLEFEKNKLTDELNTLQKENHRLNIEIDTLKEANENLKCVQSKIENVNDTDSTTIGELGSVMDLKQQLLKLQHENKMLKINQREPDEDNLCKSKINNLLIQLQSEKESCSLEIEEKNTEISDKDKLIGILQESLHQKDIEIQEYAEKFKKCINKAKSVAICMNSNDLAFPDDKNVLQNSLLKIDKEYNLKNEEEKLISTAFYKLAQTKMQDSIDQRVMNENLLQTFLSKQRQYQK